jgi:metal-dependent HD superfamily phosphatase/phosphodiesterase
VDHPKVKYIFLSEGIITLVITLVTVSPALIYQHAETSPLLKKAFQLLEEDIEVSTLLKMSNIMAVTRLRYNDHGVTHARIVAGTSLEIVSILSKRGIEFTTLRDGTAKSLDEVKLIVMLSGYLHDIGNAVHRQNHEFLGALLAKDILDRVLSKLGYDIKRVVELRQEVMHIIYSTEYDAQCLTVECGITKIADGLDMAEGRARIPYKLGKVDMHAVSALSIKRVEVFEGELKPIRISVYVSDMAGLFQLEAVLLPKIKTSLLEDLIEVTLHTDSKTLRFYPR